MIFKMNKTRFRVRAFIYEKKNDTWSTHFNANYDTKEEAQEQYNRIYSEWKTEIENGTFTLEDIWEHK